MCAAFAAALTLAGCSKEGSQDESSKNYKSVEVSINNVALGTKAIGLGKDNDLEGKKIQLNSLQFFFSDGTTFYTAKNADQTEADVYFDAGELASLPELKLSFHFLPAAVKEVIVIGNLPVSNAANKNALDNTLEIVNYQDVSNFPLYAEGALGKMTPNNHDDGSNTHLSNVYAVSLNIIPHVARFEITGIGCTLPTSSPKIVKVNKIAFADFYDKCDFRTHEVVKAPTNSLRSVELTQQGIFSYFSGQMSTSKWNNDFFNGAGTGTSGNSHPAIELTAANGKQDVNIAYNFFYQGAGAPTLLLDIIEYENAEDTNGVPGYLYTNTYKMNSGSVITSFEPGKIYRMALNFKEDDLQHQDRCLDITVTVAEWAVVEVTPEF